MFNTDPGASQPRNLHPRALVRQAIAAFRRRPAPPTGSLSQIELRRIVAELLG